MAEDWIKMRTDLYRDPKVCLMADLLMAADGALAQYVNQMCQRHMTVTRNVTRNVTVGALVSVWGVMRHRGKRRDADLVCAGVTVSVVDDIADLPGFGDAMVAAGWLVDTDEGIEFPNFFGDYNVAPGASEKGSSAERMRRFRERNKPKSDGESDASRDVTVTHREEKRREEINTPVAPKGASSRTKGEKLSLADFLTACRDAGEDAIPESDAVFAYADRIGLPRDFVALAWRWFKARYATKRQTGVKGWRQTFRNAVEGNWPKYWFQADDRSWQLTTAGKQAKLDAESSP